MGNVIPFDGTVESGEGMVNQASMTGESLPVKKEAGHSVYAGTVVEEGELTILVKATSGTTRYEKIITMIEESEKLKSSVESHAEHLADRLVPYSLGGTVLTYLLTEKIEKNDDGSKTRTATTSQSVFTTNRLLATFIKYKTQTN